MSDDSYIKINRAIFEWEWYQNINTCRLFIHMILKANWKEAKFEGTTVPRGSFVTSIGKLAEETSLTEREIRTAIMHLKTTGEVTSKTTNKYTVFTVTNYGIYQSSDKQNDKQTTSERQTNDKLTTTIEEKKERKEGKNIPPISPTHLFADFCAAYPKKRNQQAAGVEYCKVLLEDDQLLETDLVNAARNYADTVKILGTAERYIKNPNRFLSDGTYLDYLNCNYNRPDVKKSTGFNNFAQNEYDFEKLEKELLGN